MNVRKLALYFGSFALVGIVLFIARKMRKNAVTTEKRGEILAGAREAKKMKSVLKFDPINNESSQDIANQ